LHDVRILGVVGSRVAELHVGYRRDCDMGASLFNADHPTEVVHIDVSGIATRHHAGLVVIALVLRLALAVGCACCLVLSTLAAERP
jgi:hypothetical protein